MAGRVRARRQPQPWEIWFAECGRHVPGDKRRRVLVLGTNRAGAIVALKITSTSRKTPKVPQVKIADDHPSFMLTGLAHTCHVNVYDRYELKAADFTDDGPVGFLPDDLEQLVRNLIGG